MMSRICSKALYYGPMVSLLFSGAQAQEAPAAKGASLEEIVVTATRRETNLQQTAVAVTAMSAQTLEERNVTSLLDIGNYVPSLSIGTRSGTGTAGGGVSIRGMGVDALDSSSAVGTYVDEVYFASSRGNLLGLLDVERVEVLRGPQGTLFGRNTIAGAIQYVTREPAHEFGGYATATAGNYDRTDFEGALNIPLGDTLAVRFAGLYNDRDGYVRDGLTGQDRGGERVRAGRMKARWTPSDQLTVDIKGEIFDQDSNGRAVLVDEVNPNAQFVGLAHLFGETRPLDDSYLSSDFSAGDYAAAGFNAPDKFHSKYYTAQGIVNYELTDALSLKSITANAWYHTNLAQDFDNTPLAILASTWRDDTNVFTQELQLSGRVLSDRLKFVVGGFYYDGQQRQKQRIALGFAPLLPLNGYPAVDTTSKAMYGQATYDLTSQLSATVGLRYSREKSTAWLVDQTASSAATFTDWSPHFGLNFQVVPDVLLYAKASKGFRAGGIVPAGALPSGAFSFDPETAWTYEVGARLQLFDGRLRFNPTFFLTDWKDIQFNRLIPTAATVAAVTDNAGDARIKGFELETQLAVTERLQLTGSLSTLDSHYRRVEDLPFFTFPSGFPGPAVVLANISKDTPLQRAPELKFALGARYSYPLAGDSKLIGSVDYAWTDDQQSAVTISDQVELPSYGLLNARLQYEAPGGHWSVAVFGTNLTNENYLIGGVDFAGGYTTGSRELDPGRPREYGAEVRVRF